MREPEAGLPKNYAELKEVKTLRAPNKPREVRVTVLHEQLLLCYTLTGVASVITNNSFAQ